MSCVQRLRTAHRQLALLCVLVAARAPAQEVSIPIEKEPHHKTVFKNAYVQAFRVSLDPGKTGLMHTHSHDDAAVRLADAIVAADSPGEPLGPPEPVQPGMLSARDNEAKPHVHRVHNIGTTPFEAVDVQALDRPPGPTTEPISAPAVQNARMRVYRYDVAPGASTSRHAHHRPYLLVAATDVNLRMSFADGRSLKRRMKAGDMQWVDTATTHALTNSGTNSAILVEFELK